MTSFLLLGFLAVLLGAGAAWLLHLINEGMTRRVVAGLTRQNAPERATSHSYTAYDAGARVGPAMAVRGHQTGFRAYAATVPTGRTYRRYRAGDAAAVVGPIELETRTPHREPNAGSDLLVPLGQAVITATLAGLVAGFLALTAGRGDALRIVGGVFVGVLALAWLWRLGIVTGLLQTIERVTQQFDGDDEPTDDPTHSMLENPGAAREASAKIARGHAGAIRTAELLGFVTRCAAVGTSEGRQGIGTSPQARAHYAALRDALIMLGIGAWRDEKRRKAGWLLTMTPEQAAPIIARHVRELRAG
jgi:hypothetical protein